jgi:hypothetical protein
MTMLKRIFLTNFLFLPLLFISNAAFTQVNDAGLWLGLNLEKKISGNFSLNLEDELRLNENLSEAGTHYTEIGGDYKLSKGFSAGLYYRFTEKRRLDDSYSKRHRFYTELSYRRKVNRFSFTLRERLQCQYADIQSSEKGHIPEYYLRSKFSIKYRVKKRIQPFVNTEIFYQLSNAEGNEIDNFRVAGGLEYSFKKYGSVELYYLINKEINVKDPLTEYIIGLGYNYAL